MRYTTNKKVVNTTIYTVLGLVIAAVLTVTIATFVGMKNNENVNTSPDSPPNTSLPAIKPTSGNKPTVKPTPTPDTSVMPTVSPMPTIKPTPSKSDTVETLVMIPTDGAVQKEFSIDLPVFSLTMNDYRAHVGVDIAAPIGSAVVAMSDGKISNIYSDPMMGMTVSIDHGNGLFTHYKNLANEIPEGIVKGATIKAGTVIGAVGDTSLIELADAEHLHFEITKNGKNIDPTEYLKFDKVTTE